MSFCSANPILLIVHGLFIMNRIFLFLDSKSNYSLEALIEIMKDLDLNEGTILHAFSK